MTLRYAMYKEALTHHTTVVCFASKRPHTGSRWLTMAYPVGLKPAALLAELKTIGWTINPHSEKIPPTNGIVHIDVDPPRGTGVFGDWSETEKRTNLRRIRALLKRYGYGKVGHHKMTLEEML